MTHNKLSDLCPVMNERMEDRTNIEWTKADIDALGIIKVDVLALGRRHRHVLRRVGSRLLRLRFRGTAGHAKQRAQCEHERRTASRHKARCRR